MVPVSVLAGALIIGGCGSQPQIGPDREAFKSVDALYTAISLRDPGLLDRCAARLGELAASGKLPEPAHRSLGEIIAEARSGRWEPSQEQLARFMEAQRR
jgi:hypothetical protein